MKKGMIHPEFEPGSVWLTGAGPGDPGLLTLHALHALQHADVIVYDALVSEDVLAFARDGVTLEYAGKRGGRPSAKQTDISLRLVELAREVERCLLGPEPADDRARLREAPHRMGRVMVRQAVAIVLAAGQRVTRA